MSGQPEVSAEAMRRMRRAAPLDVGRVLVVDVARDCGFGAVRVGRRLG